jgi:hypothetical protein
MSGIATSAEMKVPTMLPRVERAYRRPATAPAWETSSRARRTANGETAPSSVTGTANRRSAAKKEPTTAPTLIVSRPCTVRSRTGRARKGSTAITSAATSTIDPSRRGSGRRSATLPPIQ